MNKFGLFLDFIGFVILFWQPAIGPTRKPENGGGSVTTPADEISQMEKTLKWIPSKFFTLFFDKKLANDCIWLYCIWSVSSANFMFFVKRVLI